MNVEARKRLLIELAELLERIVKLEAFIATVEFNGLPKCDVDDLLQQHNAMRAYCAALSSRVARHI